MNEKAFQKFLATGEYAIAEDAAVQGLEQESPATSVEEEEMETVSDAADKYLALDEKPMTDLQKHDKRFHPRGYKEGQKCKYREDMAKGDLSDSSIQNDSGKAKTFLLKIKGNDMTVDERRFRVPTTGLDVKKLSKALGGDSDNVSVEFVRWEEADDWRYENPMVYRTYLITIAPGGEDLSNDDITKAVKNTLQEKGESWDIDSISEIAIHAGNANAAEEEEEKINNENVRYYEGAPKDIARRFIDYARKLYEWEKQGRKGKGPKFEADGYIIYPGMKDGEIILAEELTPTWPYFHSSRKAMSWRPKQERTASMKTLMSKITDPLTKQAYRYFNGLININPTYATEPDALVDYLRGYNGDREMTYVQHFGKELTDFFERMRSLPRESAVAEMGKMMKSYAESPIMARAKKDQTGMNAGRSLDLRQNALYD